MKALLGIFDLVPSWVYAALLAAAFATGCTKQNQLDGVRLKHAELQSKFDKAKTEQSETLAKLTAEYRQKENNFETAKEEAVKNAQDKAKQSVVAVAAAAAVGDRLRTRIDELTARCTAPAPSAGASQGGPPTDTTSNLLADVQRRLDKAAEDLAGYADAARIAGEACEVSYDSLRK